MPTIIMMIVAAAAKFSNGRPNLELGSKKKTFQNHKVGLTSTAMQKKQEGNWGRWSQKSEQRKWRANLAELVCWILRCHSWCYERTCKHKSHIVSHWNRVKEKSGSGRKCFQASNALIQHQLVYLFAPKSTLSNSVEQTYEWNYKFQFEHGKLRLSHVMLLRNVLFILRAWWIEGFQANPIETTNIHSLTNTDTVCTHIHVFSFELHLASLWGPNVYMEHESRWQQCSTHQIRCFVQTFPKTNQISLIQSFTCFQDKQWQQQQKTIDALFASNGKFDQIRANHKWEITLEKSTNIRAKSLVDLKSSFSPEPFTVCVHSNFI